MAEKFILGGVMYIYKPQHQKLALASILMVALFTSISFPLKQTIGSMSLAEQAAKDVPSKTEAKVDAPGASVIVNTTHTPNKVYIESIEDSPEVSYVQDGNNVKAIINCKCDLGKAPIILENTAFGSLGDLNNALLKYFHNQKAVAKKEDKKDDKDKKKEEEQAQKENDKKLSEDRVANLKKAAKDCEDGTDDKDDSKSEVGCLFEVMNKAMNETNKDNKATSAEIKSFYNKYVSRKVVAGLSDMQWGVDSSDLLSDLADFQDTINGDKKFRVLRNEIFNDQKSALTNQINKVRKAAQDVKFAQQFKGSPYGDFLSYNANNDFYREMANFNYMSDKNYELMSYGLKSAVSNDALSQSQAFNMDAAYRQNISKAKYMLMSAQLQNSGNNTQNNNTNNNSSDAWLRANLARINGGTTAGLPNVNTNNQNTSLFDPFSFDSSFLGSSQNYDPMKPFNRTSNLDFIYK